MNDEQLFAPDGESWRRLEPAYVTARRINVVVSYLILGAFLVTPAVLFARELTWLWGGLITVVVAWIVYRWLRMPKLVASYGYCEREHDLALTKGLWFKRYTVVPYGRMQLVDVSSGPIMRKLGLAEVKLVTAAALTDAEIPGVSAAEAARLRDKFTALGESQSAGL